MKVKHLFSVLLASALVFAGCSINGGDFIAGDKIYGSIKGKILLDNKDTGNENLTVYIPGTSYVSITDTNGNYIIKNVEAAENYKLYVMKNSVSELVSDKVSVKVGEVTSVETKSIASSVFAVSSGSSSSGERPSYKELKPGDVVCKDGTVIPYVEGLGYTQANRENAVGVIYEVHETSAKCVGIDTFENLLWSNKYSYDLPQLKTILRDKDNFIITVKGKGNVGLIDNISTCSDNTNGQSVYSYLQSENVNLEDFEGFTKVNEYGRDHNFDGAYEDMWYVPSIAEMIELNKNIRVVNNVLSSLNKHIIDITWTCSAETYASGYPSDVYVCDFNMGEFILVGLGGESHYQFIAIHNVVLN